MTMTLSTRVFLLVATITLVGLGLLAWMMARIHTTHLEEEVIRGAVRLSDTICRSTRYSMLQNRKKDVYEIVSMVAAQPGIERIRIFNKSGVTTDSTVESEIGTTVNKVAESCTRCHANNGEAPLSELPEEERTRIFQAPDGHRILGLTNPIYNEPACAAVGCHPPPAEQKVLGVLDVQTSLAAVDAAVKEANGRFFFITYCFMLVAATICGVFTWRFVHLPVKTLIQGTKRLAQGDLNHRIPVQSRTEIGQLAESFNSMARELAEARAQLTDWTRTLEQRVQERTKTLAQAQAKLVRNEKLASLGRLSAVVAHEINNPLSGVLTYTKLVRKKLETPDALDNLSTIREHLEATELEIIRCGKIVRNLLAFSRESSMTVGETNINALLERMVFLFGHKLELQEITLAKAFDPNLPLVTCDADRIQQALMAVLINAIEAMPDGGALRLRSRQRIDEKTGHAQVEVSVSDTGYGIPEDVLPRLFEPFFTTKESKHGVGLGLFVVYGIMKRHQGHIEVNSSPGHGTTITLILPVRPEVEVEVLDGEDAISTNDLLAEVQV